MSANFKTIMSIENLRSKVESLYECCDSIEEFGHVGCYTVTEEDVKKKSEEIHGMLLEAGVKLDEILDLIHDQFDC